MLWGDEVRQLSGSESVISSGRARRMKAQISSERARRVTPAAAADVTRTIELVRDSESPSSERRRSSARVVPRTRSEIANRVVNTAIALVALVVFAPVILLIALAVRLTSRGPVFYSQTRVGLDRRTVPVEALYDRREDDVGGRVFTIFKFRSMYVDAESTSGAVWAAQNDPRVTPVGRFLRRCRLDELPQLINVVRGDMNIVGPRPERPSIFVQLREDVSGYALRQRTRPGITGLAQINHPYDSCLDDVRVKVRYDLEYLERQSLAEDLRIMVKTVPVMLFKKGGW